ncbi:hypothetical protein [Nocardiopsis sp. MG754419]|uniref:hypothetical protein n=1 Tax=Nocardiopsis sp. MG754419 TaxID=2259865 RepID=UPI001BAD6509|nr:hypothetical protein [Nocardiopsis sp. MG754419]
MAGTIGTVDVHTPPGAPMSVSLYYEAHRDTPLTRDEHALLTEITDAGFEALVAETTRRLPEWLRTGQVTDAAIGPREMFEPLGPYAVRERVGELFAGSAKLTRSHIGDAPLMAQTHHYLDALTRLRDAFPDAVWNVHIDDLDVPWTPGGYAL